MRRFTLALTLLTTLLTAPAIAQQPAPFRDITVDEMRGERRVALVIGNGAYADAPLRNPVNDARAVAQLLRELGFQVLSYENADHRAMRRGITTFGEQLRAGGVGLFYFSGHGVQMTGRNYLLPIRSEITMEGDVEVEGIDVGLVLARMEGARNRLNIVVLDACRDNPFERRFRGGAKGLASIDAPSGTIIAYATGPGRVARDGDGSNGVYTGELLKTMRVPGLKIEDVFKRVRQAVQQQTRWEQVPWESSSLVGDFVFALPKTAPPVLAERVPRVAGTGPEHGTLVIRSARESVEVWLDERSLGQLKPGAQLVVNDLKAGTHLVRARPRRSDREVQVREVQVVADQIAEVVIDVAVVARPPVTAGGGSVGGPVGFAGTWVGYLSPRGGMLSMGGVTHGELRVTLEERAGSFTGTLAGPGIRGEIGGRIYGSEISGSFWGRTGQGAGSVTFSAKLVSDRLEAMLDLSPVTLERAPDEKPVR